jgi:hypothetical protein
MIKKLLLVFSTAVCLFLPHIVRADCVDLGNFTSWVATSPHTVLFSRGNKLLAFIDISDCVIHPLSTIVLPKSHMCDNDTLTIDGRGCRILKLRAF